AVTGLVNGTTYQFAVSAIARATYHVAVSVYDNTPQRHESVLSPPASLAVGEDAESALSGVLTATPAPLDAYPPLTDEDACFIATAAFGSKHAADVEILRAFRDRHLLTNAPGRWLVERYYAMSPPAARWLERHAAWKPAVRIALKPVVIVALVALEGGALGLAGLAAAGAAAAAFMARRGAVRIRPAAVPPPGAARIRAARARAASGAALIALASAAGLSSLPSPAAAQDGGFFRRGAASSPRWMYSISGGYTYVDLDDYETFYGDDRDTSFALSGGYRLRDWLEVGARIAFRDDKGLARAGDGSQIADAVKLTVMPVHVYADLVFERSGR